MNGIGRDSFAEFADWFGAPLIGSQSPEPGQVLEQRSGTGTPLAQYVWSPVYVDAIIERDYDNDNSSSNGLEQRLYAMQDANYNVTGIVDTTGAVLENYLYDPYGSRTVTWAGYYEEPTSSSYNWSIGHQGLFHDPDTGLISNRNRMYSPTLGRFMQPDPGGVCGWGECVSAGAEQSHDPR